MPSLGDWHSSQRVLAARAGCYAQSACRMACRVGEKNLMHPLCIFLVAVTCGQHDPTAPATLDDYFAGRARFQVDETAIGFGGFHGIAPVRDSLEVRASDLRLTYYIRGIPGTHFSATGLATSQDGVAFNDRGIVLPLGEAGAPDDRLASFSQVWYEKTDKKYYLVYEGAGTDPAWPGDIFLATSTDGLTFAKHERPILNHRDGQPWERNNVGTPWLCREDGEWLLFYHGFDGRDVQLGLATGRDLFDLKRAKQGQPIIATSADGPDSGTVGERSLLKEGDYYYMVAEISRDASTSRTQGFGGVNWSSMIWRSRNRLDWEPSPHGPALPETDHCFGFDVPEWVRTQDGRLHIYYRAGADLGNQTRRATLVPSQKSE